jgi:hypothetical protein
MAGDPRADMDGDPDCIPADQFAFASVDAGSQGLAALEALTRNEVTASNRRCRSPLGSAAAIGGEVRNAFADLGDQLRDVGCAVTHLRLERFVRTRRYVFADHLDERGIWRCGFTFITAPHQHLRTVELCIRSGFFSQTRLANPWLARDPHQRRLPAETRVDRGAQRGDLFGAADEASPG